MYKVLILFYLLFIGSLLAANDIIIIANNQYFIDTEKKLVLTNMNVNLVNTTWSNNKSHIQLNELYAFENAVNTIEIGIGYNIYMPDENDYFKLYFTELPIISISTSETIVDDPDVSVVFEMIESNENYLEAYAGVQYRGGSSQALPKKSMEVNFWSDAIGSDSKDYSLLGLVEADGWNLQALYNEPLRFRSKTSNDIWRMINTLHYQAEEPEAINGIRMKYTEVFINNGYRGVYALGEKVNRKQLKLKKHNGDIRGELYKGDMRDYATVFIDAPSYNNNSLIWSGFEYKHPKEETDWSNLYEFVDFVVNSSDEDFYDNYESYFEMDNLVDYFIFLNLMSAEDNTGKNLYIAKYSNNDKYFYVPWDLDGSFGNDWQGRRTEITNAILVNGLYERAIMDYRPNGFRKKLKNKWTSLRASSITHSNLTDMFESNHSFLNENGVYEREELAWSAYSYDNTNINYMFNWIEDRLTFLDSQFLNDSLTLQVININKESDKVTIYPNPSSGDLFIHSAVLPFYNINIYNNLGQVVKEEKFTQAINSIDLRNLSNGVYFVQANYKNYTEVHKIIINK